MKIISGVSDVLVFNPKVSTAINTTGRNFRKRAGWITAGDSICLIWENGTG
ncbi:hypothetical protein [Chryseobacterium sp. AG844]|uniref:hypothetical protein n=1 Tax=Chryseobacterium sp. AG844 TaxID=2183998 RepID=UPI0015E8750D|nr:hypothetical protein [Chryseobacterium sp. AG844]